MNDNDIFPGFALDDLTVEDDELRYQIRRHTPPGGRGFCPVCVDERAPCAAVMFCATGLARARDLADARAGGEGG
jgi:hypothetical protein